VPRIWLRGRLEPAVRDAFERRLAALSEVAVIVDVDLPELALAWSCYTPIVRAEAAYIHRAALAAGGRGFSDGVLAPLRAGVGTTSGEYFGAMDGRRRMIDALDRSLRDVDAWLLPTSAAQPPVRGQTEVRTEDGTMSVREAVLGQTLPFSFAGVPALSLPAGFIDNLPWGLQAVGRRDGDAGLLALGRWLETWLKNGH
jgi:aspartyl-tRNA(Asn)/glutamyl-tRNA(Gln) amidotransferase subunit A